jgi:hypothetical protein
MQRSSTSVGALAAALAKAQAEIANPEKSLTATIVSPFPCEGSRSFRYAPLSTGLNLVRKCLGRHEIATVQATSIDRDSGLIRLTTTLVHASGEWIASDWPVCAVTETGAPHRMGAALTYARRYALFTLVGIAGEDDLDAPDLPTTGLSSEAETSPPKPEQGAGLIGHPSPSQATGRPLQSAERRARTQRPQPPRLLPDASEDLRRQLMSQLKLLGSPEALAMWAHRALPLKNQLSITDAQAVEAAFEARLSALGDSGPLSPETQETSDHGQLQLTERGADAVTVISKPVRDRDRAHLKFVAAQPCLVCGRTPSDPHHIKFAEQRALGRKVSDRFTVPICRLHHRELHRRGNERAWWNSQEIDPLPIAANLWATTHEFASAAADVEARQRAEGNGRHLANGSSLAGWSQNDETKPIVRPEAGCGFR